MRTSEERIRAILDADSFVELRRHAETGAAGGYGLIDGRLVYIFAQDPDEHGGSMNLRQAEQLESLYNMAGRMHAPVMELLDSSGIPLTQAMDALHAAGCAIRRKASLKGQVPTITAVMGTCRGSQAVLAGLSDFLFLESGAELCVLPSDTIIGNKDEELQNAERREKDGRIDFRGSLAEIADEIRSLVALLPSDNLGKYAYEPAEDSMNRPAEEFSVLHGAEAVRELADDRIFMQRKRFSESGMATGLIRVNGQTVGAVANEEAQVSARGLREAAEMIRFCGAFRIPVLLLCEAEAFKRDPGNAAHLDSACREFTEACSCTDAGVVTVIRRASGLPGLLLGSRAAGADLVLALEDAEVDVLDSRAAAEILGCRAEEFTQEQSSLKAAEARGLIDVICRPEEIRQQICASFEMLFSKTGNALAGDVLSAERNRVWKTRK